MYLKLLNFLIAMAKQNLIEMKKYYAISLVLFIMLYLGAFIAKIMLGGETIVPFGWSIFFGSIILNTLIAMGFFVVDIVRGKI